MEDKNTTVASPQTGISARVCPRGHVSLHIGNTCVSLWKDDFLELAQIVRVTENHLLRNQFSWQSEQKH